MATCKNDVKTLFFIFNSFSAALVGLMLFSFGVEKGVLKAMETMDIVNIVLGLSYIGIALIGYVGASAENIKLLRIYVMVMVARSISNVTRLVRWGEAASLEGVYAAMVGDTIITMVSLLLSLTILGVAAESG